MQPAASPLFDQLLWDEVTLPVAGVNEVGVGCPGRTSHCRRGDPAAQCFAEWCDRFQAADRKAACDPVSMQSGKAQLRSG
jgi:hypothetical protein